MKLRYLVPVVLLALTTASHAQTEHGQAGLYLNPIAILATNSYADSGPYALLGQNSKSAVFYGINFGALYDFPSPGKFSFGVDVRDSILHQNNAGLNNFLVGPRLIGKVRDHPAHLYLEPAVGIGYSRAAQSLVHTKKVEFGVFGGLDWTLRSHIDWRVFEIGYGSNQTQSSETIGGTVGVPSTTLINFSTGFVIRFP